MSETSDIINSGAMEKVGDIFHKLAGPLADEVGMMLGDKVRVWRVGNWVNTVKKTERILKDAGFPPKAVPPRLLLPIVEGSSAEDNETLQDMWAALLASASRGADAISPAFVETLKLLTPAEARDLQRLHSRAGNQTRSWSQRVDRDDVKNRRNMTRNFYLGPHSLSNYEAFERLSLIERDYDLREDSSGKQELVFKVSFTNYAIAFMEACAPTTEVETAG